MSQSSEGRIPLLQGLDDAIKDNPSKSVDNRSWPAIFKPRASDDRKRQPTAQDLKLARQLQAYGAGERAKELEIKFHAFRA